MKELEVPSAWWVLEAIADLNTWQFGITAGLASGKTHGAYQWFHDRLLRNAGCRFSASLWPTYQKIHDAGIPTYQKVLDSFCLRENEDYEILKSPFPKIRFLTQNPGHEVHFLSAERPKTIVAVEYSHAAEHEAGVISKEASENLRSRVRDPKAKIRQVMREGAPQGLNNFADDFDSSSQPGWDISEPRDHKQLLAGLPRRRFTVWTDDNPFVPRDYLLVLQDTYGHNQNLIKSNRFGEFCNLVEGNCYSNYFPVKHDILDREADPMRPINLCLDFNYAPLAWTANQLIPFDEPGGRRFRYIIMEEASGDAHHLDDSAVEFAAKFPVWMFAETPIKLYGDRTGHAKSHKIAGSDFENFKKYLTELGYKNVEIAASRAVAPEGASVEAVQRLFLKGLVYLCKRCKRTRISFMRTAWKKGERKIDKPANETWTHHSDGFKYFAWQATRNFNGNNDNLIIHGTNW